MVPRILPSYRIPTFRSTAAEARLRGSHWRRSRAMTSPSKEPALPARHTDQEASRWVTHVQLAQLLAARPPKQSTRISIARVVGYLMIPNDADANGFVEMTATSR